MAVRLILARWSVLSGYFSLIILLLLWHAWLFPSIYFPVSLVLLVTAAPMLLPLRGILYGRPHSHVWASYLMLLYFIHGVGEAVSNPLQLWPALLEIALSLMVFFGATFYVRWLADDTAATRGTP